MASRGVDFWNTRATERDYRKMQNRHPQLWEFVHGFIRERRIASVLEIGCGLTPPARAWVPFYQAIDLNENADAVHEDFTTMSTEHLRAYDLLLACGVIEHIPGGFAPFLAKVLEVKPGHALVSFFNGLDRDTGTRIDDPRGFCVQGYAMHEVAAWLTARKVRHQFRVLSKRDTILWIQGE